MYTAAASSSFVYAFTFASSVASFARAENLAGIFTNQRTETILVGAIGPLSHHETQIFTQAWKTTFNAIHGPNNLSIDVVEVKDKEVHNEHISTPSSHANLRSHGSKSEEGGWDTYLALQLDLQGYCLGCTLDNADAFLLARHTQAMTFKTNLPTLTRAFETELCHKLRSTSLPAFNAIAECVVSFSSQQQSFASLKDPENEDNDESTEIQEQVQTILLGLVHTLTEDDAKCLDDIWMNTYNDVHEGVAWVDSVSIRGEEIQDSSGILAAPTPDYNTWKYSTWIYLTVTGRCRYCKHKPTLADDLSPPRSRTLTKEGLRYQETKPAIVHRRFERTLCDNLQSSTILAFNAIHDCIVDFHPATAAPAVSRAQNIEVILIGVAGLIDNDETVFMDESIKMSYNSLHDQADIDLQQVALEVQDQYTAGLTDQQRNTQTGNIKYTRFRFYVSGQCRLCDPDGSDPSFLPPLLLSASSADVVYSMVLHRIFETTLCSALRSGPYPYFSAIDDCIVSFAASPPQVLFMEDAKPHTYLYPSIFY